jgi:hypothetical protein
MQQLMPAQEKLKWVTPKISLMEAEETDGKFPFNRELNCTTPNQCQPLNKAIWGPAGGYGPY